MSKNVIVYFIIAFGFVLQMASQEQSTSSVANLIDQYKKDRRGPYDGIKWFCKDQTVREARDPCPDDIGGGIQHASFKKSALNLRKTNHLFFGEILSAVSENDFLDVGHDFSRLKQYQIGKYLASVDDGWVMRRAQYYRGAFQSEDEQAWGKEFFEKILKNNKLLDQKFFLIRQALKDVPHNGDDNVAQNMRSESKIISEELPSFMDLRIKIHGQPEETDIALVEDFIKKNKSKLSAKNNSDFTKLLETMRTFYAPTDFNKVLKQMELVSEKNSLTKRIISFLSSQNGDTSSQELISGIARVLYDIRWNISNYSRGDNRLIVLDISNQLELIWLKETQNWKTNSLEDTMHKINTLACAAAGTGLLELWEYDAIDSRLMDATVGPSITIDELNTFLSNSRSIVEWSTSMVKANYQSEVDTYSAFEPLAYGFIDDRVRSSVALSLGETVNDLGEFVSKASKIKNEVMQIEGESSLRGLNPGYAFGQLIVVDGNPESIEVNTKNIYIFEKPPSDLKPVAGIMTVSEGNLVSHVQLLARNLGIPNAALSYENLKALKKHNGKKVFFAVSPKGNVILKTEDDMTTIEKGLFAKSERSKNIIRVPVDQIRLDKNEVLSMRDVNANDSGKLCGPKAANLGELKQLFPDQVVEGVIIPFGVFRSHMDKSMPGENVSYWTYLNETFREAKLMQDRNESTTAIEAFQLKNLKKLHDAILKIPLNELFRRDLNAKFKSSFGSAIGTVPVFLRSDTNMEDLKEFTGAGLNLTLFNIKEERKIIEGIKRVWASAYTERSFKWRQQYLSNPENVFPSILIIPSVDVDYSGVMITKGINTGNDEDLTVAFSRGAGGAVDGQSAETRLISTTTNVLLTPARQPDYIRLPESGGTKGYYTSFDHPILNEENIREIRKIATTVKQKIDPQSGSSHHAYDVEFGFKENKLWLFQIRPFVENKRAKSSEYLLSITPEVDKNKTILISSPF